MNNITISLSDTIIESYLYWIENIRLSNLNMFSLIIEVQ